tara:strand:+ start:1979 stop:2398 length:420 start_codon:yes stop_codon:yes gene_type:complete
MNKKYILEQIQLRSMNTLVENLGIEITDLEDCVVYGKMPVDKRTLQPFGLLHGGASVALAETLGSVGGGIQINHETHNVVGLEINTSHLRSVSEGWVYGKANAIRLGKKIQVWEISIKNQQEKIISISRLTLAVIKKNT